MNEWHVPITFASYSTRIAIALHARRRQISNVTLQAKLEAIIRKVPCKEP